MSRLKSQEYYLTKYTAEHSFLPTPGNASACWTRASDKALSPASLLPKRWPMADPALFWLWVGGIIIAIL